MAIVIQREGCTSFSAESDLLQSAMGAARHHRTCDNMAAAVLTDGMCGSAVAASSLPKRNAQRPDLQMLWSKWFL